MVFNRESDFEAALIKILSEKGWEKEVLKNYSEQDLLRNWANILFDNNRDIDRLNDYPLTDSEMQQILEQIEKQLNKKLDVIKVKTLSQEQCYTRELMLLKVKYNKNNRRDIIEICDIMKTEIVDMSKHFMMLQICDSPEKIDTLIKMLQSISIVEVARTGTLALSKCAENDD